MARNTTTKVTKITKATVPAGSQTVAAKRTLPKPEAIPDSASKVLQYDLRSRTAPVNKIRRDFNVYTSQNEKAPGTASKSRMSSANREDFEPSTPSLRSSARVAAARRGSTRTSPPRTLNSLDDIFGSTTTSSVSRLPDPDSPPKQDTAMLLEEIGSPVVKSGQLAESIFGARAGLRPRVRSSSTASSALSSPVRQMPDTTFLLQEANEAHAAQLAAKEAEIEKLVSIAGQRGADLELAARQRAELESLVSTLREELAHAKAQAEIAAMAQPVPAASAAPVQQATEHSSAELEALRKELADAYEVITILEPRENWIDPTEAAAEETRLRGIIEELDDRVMEAEVQAFKAQKELALETERLNETKELLEEAMKENEEVCKLKGTCELQVRRFNAPSFHAQLHMQIQTLASRRPIDPSNPTPAPVMAESSTQTDYPLEQLFHEANRAIALSRLIKFGNAAMYQQMLENNEEFKAAYEDLADQLKQEKEWVVGRLAAVWNSRKTNLTRIKPHRNNTVLMNMQEQLLANLQESMGDEEGEEGEGELEEGAELEEGEEIYEESDVETDVGGETIPGVCDTPRPRSP